MNYEEEKFNFLKDQAWTYLSEGKRNRRVHLCMEGNKLTEYIGSNTYSNSKKSPNRKDYTLTFDNFDSTINQIKELIKSVDGFVNIRSFRSDIGKKHNKHKKTEGSKENNSKASKKSSNSPEDTIDEQEEHNDKSEMSASELQEATDKSKEQMEESNEDMEKSNEDTFKKPEPDEPMKEFKIGRASCRERVSSPV